MNYGNIKEFDISNGAGIRTSLYVSGCSHHCKNCFNPMTWDKDYGELYTEKTAIKIIKACENKKGLSLLGGEPLENIPELLQLVNDFKIAYPSKDIWLWTGYTWDEILNNKDMLELVSLIDVLVDGRYVDALRDLKLKYKGSTNQRVIDVKQSILKNRVIVIDEYNN